jgi:hypothetical protein
VLFVDVDALECSFGFGPYLHIVGVETGIFMPHYLIQKIYDGYNNIRFPQRWLIVAMFFIAGLLVFAYRYIFTFVKKDWAMPLFMLISIGLILDVAFLPRPIISVYGRSAEVLETIKHSTVPGSVMYIPFGLGSGYFYIGKDYFPSMSRQLIHERPVVGGHLSRLSETYRDYSNPVIDYIANYTILEFGASNIDKINIDLFLNETDLRFIVIEKAQVDVSSNSFQNLLDYITTKMHFSKLIEDDFFIIYEKFYL